LFVFARHAESTANAERVLNSDPARPVALTARGRAEARALGTQLANVRVDLAVATRLLRTQETIVIALAGRTVPVLIEPGFDEIRAGDLDGGPIETYHLWKKQHGLGDRMPNGESPADAFRRHASGLRRLLGRTEQITFAVIHEHGLRAMVAAAEGDADLPDLAFANAVPFLFDEIAVRHAAARLDELATVWDERSRMSK
jgi:broad specificity phosphatase PhoE